MTAQTPTPTLSEIPLDQLYIHAMNPRRAVTDQMIEDKASSLSVNGLMQNLLGYRDPARPDQIGIVAGGLRLRGLRTLAGEGWRRHTDQPRIDAPAVLVTEDAHLAQAWAAGENIGRVDLHPAEEVRAYRDMAAQGTSPDMIARAFGRTGAHVARRLKLAGLPDAALDALAGGRISLDVAKALTLAQDETRLIEVLDAAIARDLKEWHVRAELTPDMIASTDRRAIYVGVPAYVDQGGQVSEDLFADAQLLHDEALLDRLFAEKLTAAAERIRIEEGWHQVVPVTDTPWIDLRHTDKFDRIYRQQIDLAEADSDELEQLEELGEHDLNEEGRARLAELRDRTRGDYDPDDVARGTAFVCIKNSGTIEIRRGYVPKSRQNNSGGDGVTSSGGGEKPLMPANLVEDMQRIRLAALQRALLDKPGLALDLLAYQIETACPGWLGAYALEFGNPALTPSVEDGTHVDARLADVPTGVNFGDCPTLAGFAEFVKKGKKHRNTVLTSRLARSLNAASTGGLVTDLAPELLQPDIRATWTPTAANFFTRVRPDYLDRIWAELLELADDDDRREDFARLKKAEKARELGALFSDASVQEAHGLSRAQVAAIDGWLPEGMA